MLFCGYFCYTFTYFAHLFHASLICSSAITSNALCCFRLCWITVFIFILACARPSRSFIFNRVRQISFKALVSSMRTFSKLSRRFVLQRSTLRSVWFVNSTWKVYRVFMVYKPLWMKNFDRSKPPRINTYLAIVRTSDTHFAWFSLLFQPYLFHCINYRFFTWGICCTMSEMLKVNILRLSLLSIKLLKANFI